MNADRNPPSSPPVVNSGCEAVGSPRRLLDVRAPSPAGAAGGGGRGKGWSGRSGFRDVTRPAPFGLVEPVVVSVGRVGEVHVVVVRRYPRVAIQLEVEPGEGRARTNGRWTTRGPPSFPRRVPFTTRTEDLLDHTVLGRRGDGR